ncbi:MAG TPA: helix-turn-helix transcriptional regulator [Polyangia bacterium]|jgi:DNA-binding NarL/FixJ family response regulator
MTAPQSCPEGSEDRAFGKTPRPPLSPRERQVLDLIHSGKTQKEVAFHLGLSDATVRVLYSRAMAKLGRAKRRTTGHLK